MYNAARTMRRASHIPSTGFAQLVCRNMVVPGDRFQDSRQLQPAKPLGGRDFIGASGITDLFAYGVDELVTSQQPTVRGRSEGVDRRVLQTRFHEASVSRCRVSATHLRLGIHT
jgi:hypothetical protein